MGPYAAEAEFAFALGSARLDCSAGLQCFEGEGARAVVFLSNELQCFNAFGVAAFADEELGCFFEPDHGDAEDGHDEDEGARSVPDVAPALVVGFGAGFGIGVCCGVLATKVGDEGPCKEACEELSDAP